MNGGEGLIIFRNATAGSGGDASSKAFIYDRCTSKINLSQQVTPLEIGRYRKGVGRGESMDVATRAEND